MPAMSCIAGDFTLTFGGATATQIAFSYPIPPSGTYCIIQASPQALDVDGMIFADANVDTARPSTIVNTSANTRTVVIGQRQSQLATAAGANTARHYSRALQAATTYHFKVHCPTDGTTSSVLQQDTTNIPLGQTHGDPWLSDPAHPGDQPWPESTGGLMPESFIDPLTGTLQYRIGLRGNNPIIWNQPFGSAYNQSSGTPCDSSGPWTSPCNIVLGGSGSTTVGNSTAPIVLRPQMINNNPWWSSYAEPPFSIDQIGLSLTGAIDSPTTANRVLDVCLSLNGGASCASPAQQMTMGQTASTVTLGDAPVAYYSATTFGADEWVVDTNPRLNVQESSPHAGAGIVSGSILTNASSPSGSFGSDFFSLYWTSGGNGHIRISRNNDACTVPSTATEYIITSFVNGSQLIVSGTPPSGSAYWCEDNFTLLVWRAQPPGDSSTVTLTGAILNVLGSAGPSYPDDGAGTDCFNTEVYGGFFCLYGSLYWINPTDPTVVWYGIPYTSSDSIENSWTGASVPTAESASIDQTQSNLTFYTIGGDPAGTSPLVIQGVFNPGSTPTQPATPQGYNGAQIGGATVASTTAYSVTWTNGLTFTNLTPQTTLSQSVFQQAAALDPTWSSYAYLFTGQNCALSSAASQGVFFMGCVAVAQDSPAWIFALSPGNRNPACAGPTACGGAGPQIIGAINTFNTPNGPVAPAQGALTGRSLHAIAGTGESGWIAIGANEYAPINTSATSIPSSSSACSTFSGLGSLSGQCIQIDINSFVQHGLSAVTSVSGSPPAGVAGQTCLLSLFNNGLIDGAATVTLGSTNSWSGAIIAVTNPGYDAFAAPTSVTVTDGTASCPTSVAVGATVTSVTGYEPYLATPNYPPFLGNPGELRTTQIGDTACVTTTSAGICSWANGANELMTLVEKNAGGQWIFQRGTHDVEQAVTGPIALWWESYQSLIPPGATNQFQELVAFWNPTAGCGGAPDPHGNCLIMDQNETNGHSEWQDGGEAATTNVPNWGQTYYGWPFSYQTIPGSITTPCTYSNLCILAYPFADFLPDPDTYANPYPPPTNFTWQEGVNYTDVNPGFACYGSGGYNCTYGVPWGFDAGSHPNPAAANDPNKSTYAFDNTPVQGGQSDVGPFILATNQLYTVLPLAPGILGDGDNILFDYPCSLDCAAPINRKVVATGASCGSHPLIDLSGPASTIASGTSGSYTYCIARTAGECQSTSVEGEVYVNCPGVVYTFCTGTAISGGTPLGVGNDICVVNMAVSGNAIRQFAMTPPGGSDAPGACTRNLVSATSRLRMVTGFENNRVLPFTTGSDHSWILYRQEFLNYQRQDMWMSLAPGWPATPETCSPDNFIRGQFIPEVVTVPAYSGANGAVIEFGYQEYGLPTGYSKPAFMNCTTRNDPCRANATTINSPPYYQMPQNSSGGWTWAPLPPPFYFKSEFKTGGPSPEPCSGGCTIAVPAISQRMLFYRVLYFSGNKNIAASATSVVEVP